MSNFTLTFRRFSAKPDFIFRKIQILTSLVGVSFLKSSGSFILVSFLFTTINAQPIIDWEVNLGGVSSEEAKSVVQTEDGGYVVAGWAWSTDGDVGDNNGYQDFWIVKLDGDGGLQWERNYGGSDYDAAYSIVQTSDGGYAVAGTSMSDDGDVGGNNGNTDYWVIKLNSVGALEWERNYGGSGGDYAYSIIQTFDGGYAVAGYSDSNGGDISENFGGEDYWIVKLDNTGNIEWEQSYGGSGWERAYSIIQTSELGYALAGWSESSDGVVSGNNGEDDVWIIKINSIGMLQWERNYGGSSWDGAKSIIQTIDGGFAVAGYSASDDGDVGGNFSNSQDFWILKLNTEGFLEWEGNYGGSSNEQAHTILQNNTGSLVVAGFTRSSDGDVGGNIGQKDLWVVQVDAAGNLEWEDNYGGSNWEVGSDDFNIGNCLIQNTDGDYIVATSSRSSNGDVGGNNGDQDFWVLKLNEEVSSVGYDSELHNLLTLHPNPSTGIFTIDLGVSMKNIRLILTDVTGATVFEQRIVEGQLMKFNMDLPNGIYLFNVFSNDGNWQKRLVLQR